MAILIPIGYNISRVVFMVLRTSSIAIVQASNLACTITNKGVLSAALYVHIFRLHSFVSLNFSRLRESQTPRVRGRRKRLKFWLIPLFNN